MKEFYVYLHFKPNGDVFYVGKGCGRRCQEFSISRTIHHKRIVAKYGKENIGVLVFPQTSEREALDTEAIWIKRIREAGESLINITSGGIEQSGYKHTPEARAVMSKKLIGNTRSVGKKLSDETKRRLAEINKGKKQSDETVAKRIAKTTGQKRSKETCEAISAKAKGRTHSPETRARLSEIAKSRTHSAETRAKMSDAHRRRHQMGAGA